MTARDCHKLTLINFNEYGPLQALVLGGCIYDWAGRGFWLVRRELICGIF